MRSAPPRGVRGPASSVPFPLVVCSLVVASGALTLGCESLPGTPTQASALCAEVASIVCDADNRCFGGTGTRAECLTAQTTACDESLGALARDARLGYDDAHAGAFLASLETSAQSCWRTPADIDAFVDVFEGTGGQGADCTPRTMGAADLLTSSLSCAEGLACRIHVRIDDSPQGVCEPRRDSACSHPWDCDAGSYCSLPSSWRAGVWGDCRPRRADGWACTSDLECASLHCDGECGPATEQDVALVVTYPALVAASEPEAYFRLNESSGGRSDEEGGTSAAASGGAVTRVAMGAIEGDDDGAAVLSGGSFLRVSAPDALIDQDALTLECWVRPDALSAQPLLEIADAMDFGPGLWTHEGGDRVRANFRDAESEDHTVGSGEGSIEEGEWHHVVASYDGTRGVLYLDGRRIGETTLTGALRVEGDLLIGHRNAYGESEAQSFTGAIDEVAVYARSLSESEVRRHHSAGTEGPIENPFPLFTWVR